MQCPSCCPSCRLRQPAQVPDEESGVAQPFSLPHFLQAGTLRFTVYRSQTCAHAHESDEWHALPSLAAFACATEDSTEYGRMGQALDFLVNERFAALTYRHLNDAHLPICTLLVRVYLIPHDLAGVGGALMRRPFDVRSKAREMLLLVLRHTSRRWEDWQGVPASTPTAQDMFVHNEVDHRSMSDVFSQLPSPCKSPPTAYTQKLDVQRVMNDVLEKSAPPGMRSTLYGYQKRTLARMLLQELDPTCVADPTFLPATSVHSGTRFHFRPSTFEVRRELPVFFQNRRGILCENMGSGKTVEVLALLLATKTRLPAPEETRDQISHVTTPLAMRCFPWDNLTDFAGRCGSRDFSHLPSKRGVPSLAEITLNVLRTRPLLALEPDEEDKLRNADLWEPLMRNTPCYFRSGSTLEANFAERPKRRATGTTCGPGPRRYYLTAATLIIVPGTLYTQWLSEITKHCEDGALRVLAVESKSAGAKHVHARTALPHPSVLASDYDLVLITHDRLSNEPAKGDAAQLHTWRMCTCPVRSARARVPHCTCGPDARAVSPLLQVHWQRVVIDEGHTLQAHTTQFNTVADALVSDARWIVTGTPTTNLRGLGLGTDAEDEVGGGDGAWPYEDLAKLGKLLVGFLHLPQVTQEPGSNFFETRVAAPLRRTGGPEFGAVAVMQQLMEQCMIRNRESDVKREVVLPPLRREVVMLELEPLATITYNVLLSLFAINAVDSERTDQDYLFHATKTHMLRQAMENLSQSLFWFSEPTELHKEMPSHMQRAQNAFNRAAEKRRPLEDMELLRQAIWHMSSALRHPVWLAAMGRIESFIPFAVSGMPTAVHEAWGITSVNGPTSDTSSSSMYAFPDRLIALRDWTIAHPTADEELIHSRGRREEKRISAYEGELREKEDKERGASLQKSGRDAEASAMASASASRVHVKTSMSAKVAEPPAEDGPLIKPFDGWTALHLQRSCLAQTRVGKSASSKLNVVLQEILEHSANDKFLIFSQSPLSLAHVGEGLTLLGISHRTIMTGIERRHWAANTLTFQSADKCRVLLMELKYGARGLNLTAATRVIFLEPVWKADVELQAIKRAHRIGQTGSISVKTLAIRSTAEEQMLLRRETIRSGMVVPEMLEEVGMRHYIEHPKFVPVEAVAHSRLAAGLEVPLIPTAAMGDVPGADGELEITEVEEVRPRKKVKTVRFAE